MPNLSHYATKKITTNKYKCKTFEELATEIINNDKKYLTILTKTINTPKTPTDKKNEIQEFLNYFFQHFEPNFLSTPTPPTTTLTQSHPFWIPPTQSIQFPLKITHIIHISDIHIRLYNRNKEYQDVFNKLYNLIDNLIQSNPNQIIIITGDLLHSKNTLSPECIITTQEFLLKLSSFTTTLLIAGNHDALLTNNQREDSITAIINNVKIPNFYYLKNSAVYLISNLAIAVNSLLDNKWIFANSFTTPPNITHKISLYHGGVGLCDTGVGHRLRGEKLVEDFDGFDYALLGDIHKFQFIEDKRIAYASSLIAQNFNEWNSPHGALHWDLFNQNHQYFPIENDYGFFIFNLNNNEIFIENNPISTSDIPSYLQKSSMNIKLNIQNCSTEFVSKINYIVKQSCPDVKIIHNYLGTKTKETQPEINLDSTTLLKQQIQKSNPNIQQNDIDFILQKYQEFSKETEINNELSLSRWELIDLEFSNLFGYGPNNLIEFNKFSSDNPIGIIAPNSHGKSSLIDIILLTLFTKFSRSRGTGISKDIININCNNFSSKLRFKIGSDLYVIIKEGKREQSDKIKIFKNEFYKQTNDILTLLTDEDRKKTDKIISELIGTYDDFIFTNVQLQNRTNSFKEMTDKERKEYLYKVLKLNIWNDVAKKISESTKPLKNSITYLEKTIENKSIDEMIDKLQDIEIDIELTQDKINQQSYEKTFNMEELENERQKLIPNISCEKYDENDIQTKLSQSKKTSQSLQKQINSIQLTIESLQNQTEINDKEKIINEYNELKKINDNNIKNLEKSLSKLKLQALIPTNNLWNKITFKEKNTQFLLKTIKENIESINSNEIQQELDENNEKINNSKNNIQSIQLNIQKLENEKIISQNMMHIIRDEKLKLDVDLKDLKYKLKVKQKERELVKTKIENFKNELELDIYKRLKEEEPLREDLKKLKKEENEIQSLLKNLENHEYDPKCKFCIKHPIIKQKEEKTILLKEIKNNINLIKKSITIENHEEINQKLDEIKQKLQEKESKLTILETTVIKLELEYEKNSNIQEKIEEINRKKQENEEIQSKISNISEKIISISSQLTTEEKNLKKLLKENENLQSIITQNISNKQKLENQLQITLEIIEIDEKNSIINEENQKISNINEEISQLNNQFTSSKTYITYQNLQNELNNQMQVKLDIAQNQNKLQELQFNHININNNIQEYENILQEISNSKESIQFNQEIRNNIDILQLKINKNENLMSKLNEKLGVFYQQYQDIVNEQKIFLKQIDELKSKRNEYKLMQTLEQSLGKDGLPLTILENYLVPITDSINNIIAPFISRKINLYIDEDDLILDSFPDSGEKSVYIHGGMESFILDIAFKITLSNFAKLPKCDILFLDEGISAFDNERLSNIDTLFNFIKRYFSKTILITHIDSVKENIVEKIGIIKENNFSKIVCEYSS